MKRDPRARIAGTVFAPVASSMLDKARAAVIAALVLVVTAGACQSEEPPSCTPGVGFDIWGECPGAPPTACVGPDADGRVDIDVAAAWPKRTREPPPLTQAQIAEACAALAACPNFSFERVRTVSLGVQTPNHLLAACLQGGLDGYSTEERAIPIDGYDERFSFLLRAVLSANGDCATIQSVLSRSQVARECQEDGCWVNGERPHVTCQGDVAVFAKGGRRDCARSYTRCSTASATGCTDRPLIGCPEDARDRCDGDIKLGCDSCGYVTFRDCGWNGGRCVETADGAHCANAADECRGAERACDGATLSACVSGARQAVDCAALGASCEARTVNVRIDRDAGVPSPAPDAGPDEFSCQWAAFLGPSGSEAYECVLARCARP